MAFVDITNTYGDAKLVVFNKKTGRRMSVELGDGQLELIAEMMQLEIVENDNAVYMLADDIAHEVAQGHSRHEQEEEDRLMDESLRF